MPRPHDLDWGGKRARRQEIKSHVKKFLLYPTFWSDNTRHIGFPLRWRHIKFEETNFNQIPTGNGLYCFVVIPPVPNLFITRYLFYVGKASGASLRSRYKQYINEKNGIGVGDNKPRVKVEEMLNEYYGHIHFFFVEMNSTADIIEGEEKLLNSFYPHVNVLIPEATISDEYKYLYE